MDSHMSGTSVEDPERSLEGDWTLPIEWDCGPSNEKKCPPMAHSFSPNVIMNEPIGPTVAGLLAKGTEDETNETEYNSSAVASILGGTVTAPSSGTVNHSIRCTKCTCRVIYETVLGNPDTLSENYYKDEPDESLEDPN